MNRLIWIGAAIAMAGWSLMAFIVHGLVDVFGSAAAGVGAVPGFAPDPLSWGWFAATLRATGLSAIWGGWAIGIAIIAALAYAASRLTGRRKNRERDRFQPKARSWGSAIPSGAPPEGRRGKGGRDVEDMIKAAMRRFARR